MPSEASANPKITQQVLTGTRLKPQVCCRTCGMGEGGVIWGGVMKWDDGAKRGKKREAHTKTPTQGERGRERALN